MVEVMEKNRDVWTGWAYWAAGDWWPESEPLNIQPVKGRDRPQLKALSRSGALSGGAGKCPALENGG
jgi:endoglucanase